MNKILNLSLALILLFSACSSPSRDDLYGKIKDAESQLFDQNESFKFNKELANNTILAYENFTKSFPNDSLTPGILFKEADLHRALKEYDAALDIYKKIETDYSSNNKAPHSLFLQGFVYENEVGDLDKAKDRYSKFLEEYPNHELADDVKFSLDNLGKSPEDIIKEFNQKQKTTAQDSLM